MLQMLTSNCVFRCIWKWRQD